MITLTGKWQKIEGKAFGLALPSLIGSITISLSNDAKQQFLNQLLSSKVAVTPPVATADKQANQAFVESLLFWQTQIQLSVHIPIFETGQILNHSPLEEGKERFDFILPSYRPEITQYVFTWLLQTINASDTPTFDKKQFEKSFRLLRSRLVKSAPSGSNTFYFLKAAHDLNIPWRHLSENIFEYGQGHFIRRLDSSFTDQTSTISARIVRDKHLTSKLLKDAGLPVARNAPIRSATQAKCIAKKLGFPVVIKPGDKDGGVGVTAGITNNSEIDDAFLKARRFSKKILIEKHINGQDYRLTVLNGKLVWAVLRQPGGVTGNGKDSIISLLKQVNADPRRQKQAGSPLKMIELDKEAQDLLARAGLSIESVPNKGQFIPLRSTANIANGGMPVAVMKQVHPDNKLLAETAAKALDLDFAGIDLIIPDIRQSWRTSEAGICEVNAQPQLGNVTRPQLYSEVLNELLGGNGRIPCVLIINDDKTHPLTKLLAQNLSTSYNHVAIALKLGISINEMVINKTDNVLNASQAALSHPDADAVIISSTSQEILQSGLATDQFDLVIMMSHDSAQSEMIKLCHMLFAHPIGQLLLTEGNAPIAQLARKMGITKISQYAKSARLDDIANSATSSLL